MDENDRLWEEAKKDFPYDPALQQVRYARLKIAEQTKGMTPKQFVEYINAKAKKVLKEAQARKASRGRK